MSIADVMTVKIVSVEPTDSVAHTIQRMVDENVGAIMVCEEGRIVGIFSECDVLRLAAVSSSFTSRQVDEVAGQPARPAIPITVLHHKQDEVKALT